MDAELRSELEGLVCSFLQTNLKNFPTGMPLSYFERSFHEQADEDHDWYKRFKTSSPLEALQCIPNVLNISGDRRVGIRLSMNKNSDKADPLLIELIEGQRSSAKRKRPIMGRPSSQRVRDSFDMNRRFSNSGANYAPVNRFERVTMRDQNRGNARYNNYNNYGNNHAYTISNRGYTSQYNRQANTTSTTALPPAPADPRLRHGSQALPSQARQPPTPQSAPTPAKQPTPSKPPLRPVTSSLPTFRPNSSAQPKPVPVIEDSSDTQRQYDADPTLNELRKQVRQKLVRLLLKRTSEVKLLYLSYIYKDEYGEELDYEKNGYKSVLNLLQDPSFSDQFRITYKGLDTSVSLKRDLSNGAPVAAQDSNAQGRSGDTSNVAPFVDKTNFMTPIQKKYDACDAFNIRSMLHELGSLKAQEPILYNNKIEEIIIFRTARMILTSEGQMLKLDEWERRYQQAWNYNNRISINDYGCRTLLEFFKLMAQDIPMKIHLVSDEWIAKSSKQEISTWIERKLSQGRYKVLIVADPKYDQVAYPGDTYPLLDISNLPQDEWFQAVIMSINKSRMWLQLRTVVRVRDHLQIETSLTCYQDHKRKNYFSVAPALIKVGFPCVAFDDLQNRWCRAMIVGLPDVPKLEANSLVSVFLVDYAIFRKVPIPSLSCILKSHLRQPVGLIYAHLNNIEQGKVDLAARMLKEFTSPPVTLACKFLQNTKPKPRDEVDIIWPSKKDIRLVCLKDTRQGNDIDLAEAINASTGTGPIEID